MKKKVVIGVCISLLFLSGCWDSKELNDRAIWVATGWDVAEDGNIDVSGQIVIPANIQTQGGGGGKAGEDYFVISAKGKNIDDALQNMQTKLPRKAFFGQRRVTFFGEEFARRGLIKETDINGRTPDASLRGDMFVLKGSTAKEVLTQANPLEKIPAIATLKEHKQGGGRGDTTYLKFLIAANRDGIRPSLPTIEVISSIDGLKSGKVNPKILRLAGASVFDRNLKMLGYLNTEENRDLLWVMGSLKKMTITIPQKDGKASINLTKIKSKIEPKFNKYNQVRFTVILEGEGSLKESNSGLDLRNTKNRKFLEREFEKEAQIQVQRTIKKVQDKYGMDIFGFGENVHRKNPSKWKSLESKWDQIFPEMDIAVKAHIKINQIGMDGPSLLYRESETKR